MNGVVHLRSWAGVCLYTEADEGIDRGRHSAYRLREAASPPFATYQLQGNNSPSDEPKHANTFDLNQRGLRGR
jgi:hypothetical protein